MRTRKKLGQPNRLHTAKALQVLRCALEQSARQNGAYGLNKVVAKLCDCPVHFVKRTLSDYREHPELLETAVSTSLARIPKLKMFGDNKWTNRIYEWRALQAALHAIHHAERFPIQSKQPPD